MRRETNPGTKITKKTTDAMPVVVDWIALGFVAVALVVGIEIASSFRDKKIKGCFWLSPEIGYKDNKIPDNPIPTGIKRMNNDYLYSLISCFISGSNGRANWVKGCFGS